MRTSSIPQAQAEASCRKGIIDHGEDPRQMRADKRVAKEAAETVKEALQRPLRSRESGVFGVPSTAL